MTAASEVDPVAIFESLTIESLDAAIAALQKEIDDLVAPRTKRMDSLKACRRAVDIRVNGMGQRRPRSPNGTQKPRGRPATESEPETTEATGGELSLGRVVTLLKVAGPCKMASIASQMAVPCNDELREILSDQRYFRKDNYGRFTLRAHAK
jgi:uncharacterized small protein (DUF1192 family)